MKEINKNNQLLATKKTQVSEKQVVFDSVSNEVVNIINNKSLKEYIEETPSFNRFYLFRHLDIDKSTWSDNIALSGFWTEEWRQRDKLKQVDKSSFIWSKLDNFLSNYWKRIYIFWDEDWEINNRSKQTIEVLNEKWYKTLWWWLQWTDKWLDEWWALLEVQWEFNQVADDIILENIWEDVLMIWNRSYAHAMKIKWIQLNESLLADEKDFERKWYDYIDFYVDESKTGWFQVVWNENTYLRVTLENEREIKSIFWIAENLDLKNTQNWLNNYFKDNPDLYLEYLNSENFDISYFCLANLLEREYLFEDKYYVEKISDFLYKSLESNTEKEKLEIFELLKDKRKDEKEKQKTAYLNRRKERNEYTLGDYYRNIKEISRLSDIYLLKLKQIDIHPSNITKEEKEYFRQLVDVLRKSEQRAQDIFDKSLDDLVKAWETIDRWFYTYKRKTDKEIGKLKEKKWRELVEEDYYKKVSVFTSSILNESKVSVFLANVWEWKSTQLAKIKEEIDTNIEYKDFIPLFYRAKDYGKSDSYDSIIWEIESAIQLIGQRFLSKNIVIFFDGIDELDTIYKEDIKQKLLEKQHIVNLKVILWSRKSEFNEYPTDKYNSIWFDELSEEEIDIFIKDRLIWLGIKEEDVTKKIKEIEEFLWKNIIEEELKSTPLILFFIVKLSFEWNLENINNRAQLYKKIFISILIEHNWENEYFCVKNYLPHLSKIAFDIENGVMDKIPDDVVQSYAVLFKKEREEKYSFIHKSFQEYFLAEYLSDIKDWEKYIFKEIKKWRNVEELRHIILLYSEILFNESKFIKLNKLLKWLFKYDDIFYNLSMIGWNILDKFWYKEELIGIKDIYSKKIKQKSKKNIVIGFNIKYSKQLKKNVEYTIEQVIDSRNKKRVLNIIDWIKNNKINLEEEHKLSIYTKLVENGYFEFIKEEVDELLGFIEDENIYFDIWVLYVSLLEQWKKEYLEDFLDFLKNKYKWWWVFYMQLYKSPYINNKTKVLEEIEDYINKMYEINWYEEIESIYIDLLKEKPEKNKQLVLKWFYKLIEKTIPVRLTTTILSFWYKDILTDKVKEKLWKYDRENTERQLIWIDFLIEMYKIWYKWNIELIKENIQWLIHREKYRQLTSTFRNLLGTWEPELIEYVKKFLFIIEWQAEVMLQRFVNIEVFKKWEVLLKIKIYKELINKNIEIDEDNLLVFLNTIILTEDLTGLWTLLNILVKNNKQDLVYRFLKKTPREVLKENNELYTKFLEILRNLNIRITEKDINF